MKVAKVKQERPILFSGQMVRAILEGRKTQTRRVVKPVGRDEGFIVVGGYDKDPNQWPFRSYDGDAFDDGNGCEVPLVCPYGVPGDRLWVRETWKENIPPSGWIYRATDEQAQWSQDKRPWRPSIFMPREASRITLEITEVRVERLQEIGPVDIAAEGVTQDLIKGLVYSTSLRLKQQDQHWIHGADEGLSWCRKCAEKEISRLKALNPDADICLDGGWDTEEDGPQFCEGCEVSLSCSYTDYGAEQDLQHYEEYGFNPKEPSDCESLCRILGASLWDGGDLSDRLKKLAWSIIWDSINGKKYPWNSNPWVWVVTFALRPARGK